MRLGMQYLTRRVLISPPLLGLNFVLGGECRWGGQCLMGPCTLAYARQSRHLSIIYVRLVEPERESRRTNDRYSLVEHNVQGGGGGGGGGGVSPAPL